MRAFLLPSMLLMIFGGLFGVTKATEAQDLDLSEIIVSLEFSEDPLQEVLGTIEAQTKLTFAYSYNAINLNRKVSITAKRHSVKQVLKHLFKNYRVGWGLSGKTILLKKWPAPSQSSVIEEVVEGQVIDAETGEMLPGVNILVKGTTQGASTNANGRFELSVPSLQDTLVFSYIGYKTQEIPIAGRTKIDVQITPKAVMGEEMVVVGYGTQKEKNLVGSIEQLSIEDISARPTSDITSTLQGRIPGLNIKSNSGDPSETADFNIRGFNSINGGSPLVLVDGIEEDISNVNPNDIEEVTVLKDAGSAAIYGARASFGVILITTKKGEEGKMKVNYTTNFNFTTPTTRTDFISDPYVYGKTIDSAIYGYNGSNYTGYEDDWDWKTIQMVADGDIEPFHEKQSDGSYKFFHKTNFYNYLFKKWQPSNFHDISISGGSEKLQGYVSGRIYKRENINNIQDTDMKRYNFKANLKFKPYKWLELSTDSKYANRFDENYGGYENGYGGIWSTTTWRDKFAFYPKEIDGMPVDVGRGGNGGAGGYAAMEDGNNWRRTSRETLTNTFKGIVNPFEGLEINFDYSHKVENTNRTYRYSRFDYLYSDQLDLVTKGLSRHGEWRWKDKYNVLNLYGTFSKTLFDDHDFKIMLGYNRENFDRDRVKVQVEDMLIRDKANLVFGTTPYDTDGSAKLWGIAGYFGRFNYDYGGKYLLEINARYDGSSRFPEGERWGLFPSVAAGWRVSEEKFWTSTMENIISSMKIRLSYGRLGNQNVGVNTFRQLMTVNNSSWYSDGKPIKYARAPKPLPATIGWEKVETINTGIDFGFLEEKLTASIDLYQRETTDMYLPGEPLPAVFGASEPSKSYASLRNRGFELTIGYNDQFEVMGSKLAFNVSANVSNYKGVITKFDNPNGLMSTFWEGQELGEIWGYHVDGQFQSDEEAAEYQSQFTNPSDDLGDVYRYIINTVQNSDWDHLRAGDLKYVDTDGDGRIGKGENTLDDHGDLRPIGNAMPKFPFGFNINANWQDFDISIVGQGVAKQDWYPTGPIYWGPYSRPYLSFIRKDLVDNAWSEEHPENTYPQIERGYAALNARRSMYELNDYYLTNIGYLRIKNLTIGYTLPKEITKKVNINKFRIFFSGENIFTWRFGGLTKYIDPEQAGAAISYSNPSRANARNNYNVNTYPMGKTYSIGINVSL